MKYGIFGSAVGDGTLDDVVAQAASTERDGFAAYWAPNIFGHDAMTALAGIGVTDFAAVEFGATADEVANTREALKGLLSGK